MKYAIALAILAFIASFAALGWEIGIIHLGPCREYLAFPMLRSLLWMARRRRFVGQPTRPHSAALGRCVAELIQAD
jgi:hypothetical protein